MSRIKGNPSKWKPFVANRVSKIQTLTPPSCWHLCLGKENPADILSRGSTAEQLISFVIWLNGPVWLASGRYPNSPIEVAEAPDESVTLLTSKTIAPRSVLPFERWNKFTKTLRVIVWVKRFLYNYRSGNKISGELSHDELSQTKTVVFKTCKLRLTPKKSTGCLVVRKFGRNPPWIT